MQFGVFKENIRGETRVALVPDSIRLLVKKKHAVLVQSGAGVAASIPDAEFQAAGARIVPDAAALAAEADCLLRICPVSKEDAMAWPEGKALIGFLAPLRNPELLQVLAQRRMTSFSLDAIPRITRAQSMDTLSSMATVAGYSAVLLAASNLPEVPADVDNGGGDHPASARADFRRRRGWFAGHRHRPALGRGGGGL